MKKTLLSIVLIANSIIACAIGLPQVEKTSSTLCNNKEFNNVALTKEIDNSNEKESIYLTITYYNEFQDKNKNKNKKQKNILGSIFLVHSNSFEYNLMPFNISNNSHYLLGIKDKNNLEINDGNHYIDKDGNTKKIKHNFESKSLSGKINTNFAKNNNTLNMKICLSKEWQDKNLVEYKQSLYKEINVKINENTIIDLGNGDKMDIEIIKGPAN